jgi:hypothetical protein
MQSLQIRSFVVIMSLAAGEVCRADDQAPKRLYFVFHPHAEGTPAPGKPRCIPHTDERAGYPRTLSDHPETSATSGGIGYHVGGGVPLRHGPSHGHGRYADEGTWGWDETGFHLFRRRVILGWSHGRKYQGGTGAYRTDGHPIPDVIAAAHSKIDSLHARKEGE